jgi:diacylglycerol kinase (ATP)
MDGQVNTSAPRPVPKPASTPAPACSPLVVFNPTAGGRKARRLASAMKLLRTRGAVPALATTTARGDAEALARRTLAGRTIIVAGGDGTINEAVNGLIAAGGGRLAVIPLGTANVLAAELGIENLAQAAEVAVAGRPLLWHPGLANGRAFVLMAGVGFDAHVVAALSPRLKRYLGRAAYVLEMLRQLHRFRFPTYRVSIDGRAREAASIVVTHARYYGGRFVLAPGAQLDRAELHVCLFRRGGRWRAIRYAIALALNLLPRSSEVEILRAKRVEIEGPAGDPVQGDGDIIARLPVAIELSSVTLELMRP